MTDEETALNRALREFLTTFTNMPRNSYNTTFYWNAGTRASFAQLNTAYNAWWQRHINTAPASGLK